MMMLALAAAAARIPLTDEEICARVKSGIADVQEKNMTVDCPAKLVNVAVDGFRKRDRGREEIALKRHGWRSICVNPNWAVVEFTKRGWRYAMVENYRDGSVLTVVIDCTAGPPA